MSGSGWMPECIALGYKSKGDFNKECSLWAVIYPDGKRSGGLSAWIIKQRADVRVVVLKHTPSGYEKVSEPAWWTPDVGQSPPNRWDAIRWVQENVSLEE